MAIFEYLCRDHGRFEVSRPVGTAEPGSACPACGADSARVFSPPGVSRTPERISVARGLEEKSRDAPDVVTSLPPRRRTPPRATNPALRRLPRP